ncbi:MAG: DNA/RNA non-specific endonuclease [Treponema sp.]|nr:DNA/RNA non-specific endonuclease [Treponema sp.]
MAKKSKKVLPVILTILVIVLIAAWYLCGKPYIVPDEQGLMLVMTEEPILPIFEEEQASGGPSTSSGTTIPADGTTMSGVPEPVEGRVNKNISSGTADLGHAENSSLYFGNPTDAFTDTALTENYLMIKPQYTLSYNTQTLCPNWVAWHLDSENMGDADRSDDFRPDKELPEGWYGVKKADYQFNKYGFDRGHVCPSADRTATKEDNSMTFLMTNMVPQTPDNNRVIWMHFETFERELVQAGNEVYIIAGPYGTGGTSPKGTFDNIPISLKSGETYYMNVPAYTWKVLIAIPAGTDDLERVDSTATAIAINVPNQTGMQKTGDWEQFLCSIDDIEEMTGYDFFELLPDNVEDVLEKTVYVP